MQVAGWNASARVKTKLQAALYWIRSAKKPRVAPAQPFASDDWSVSVNGDEITIDVTDWGGEVPDGIAYRIGTLHWNPFSTFVGTFPASLAVDGFAVGPYPVQIRPIVDGELGVPGDIKLAEVV